MRIFLTALILVNSAWVAHSAYPEARLELERGDRIVFLGNTFAERLRHFGHFETALLLAFPDFDLTFRNLGWSADEVSLRPRPLNFGDIHTHLTEQQADVIFLYFGSNESFKGKDGLSAFQADYQKLIDGLIENRYNGESPPRLVLVSPIPQEKLDHLPAFDRQNKMLALYTGAIERLAADNGLPFIDLFEPLGDLYGNGASDTFTFNGVHLTDYGYWAASSIMLSELGYRSGPLQIALDIREGSADSKGDAVEILDALDSIVRFQVHPGSHVHLPPPDAAAVHPQLGKQAPILKIDGLSSGRYTLMFKGEIVAEATDAEWRAGVRMRKGFFGDYVYSVREAVNHKNLQFFDRWRAVNGFYIYGDRKKPFGVVNFPPEMARFDELIRQEELAAGKRIVEMPSQTFSLVRVGS